MVKPIPGVRPSEVQELTRAQDRLTFVYVEHCVVNRDGNALTAQDARGTVHIPTAMIGAVLFGPGTSVTHQAMVVLSDAGATAVWVGEHGVRYYCHGRPLSRSSRLLLAQADAVSKRSERLRVARRMYEMRFPDEVFDGETMAQLRGHEGVRVRKVYRDQAERFGVKWDHRSYNPQDFSAGDPANQALTAATTCLYGAVHAVVVALGCSPGLGFIHTGHDRSFVYDIADLYKMEIAVPVAFEMAAKFDGDELPGRVRRAMRDEMKDQKLLVRCVNDIHRVLGLKDDEEQHAWDIVELWDGAEGSVAGGKSWGEQPWS